MESEADGVSDVLAVTVGDCVAEVLKETVDVMDSDGVVVSDGDVVDVRDLDAVAVAVPLELPERDAVAVFVSDIEEEIDVEGETETVDVCVVVVDLLKEIDSVNDVDGDIVIVGDPLVLPLNDTVADAEVVLLVVALVETVMLREKVMELLTVVE